MEASQSDNDPTITQKLRQEPRFIKFLAWLKQNGAIIDERIDFPTAFIPQGCPNSFYIGASTNAKIENRRAIIAIPQKLIITAQAVKQDSELAPILKENSRFFSRDANASFNLLTLYVIRERLKGEKSFYNPYFDVAHTKGLLTDWSKKQIGMLEHKLVMDHLTAFKDDTELSFMDFLRIFKKYEKVLSPQKSLSNEQFKKLFDWACEFVCTRAFGWSVPSVSLIPFADSLNHGINYLDHFHVDILLQKPGILSQGQLPVYSKKKGLCNLNIFNKQWLVPSPQQFKKFKEMGSYRQAYIKKHENLLIASTKPQQLTALTQNPKKALQRICHQQYSSGNHSFRQLQFCQSSCSEDNDTDQEDFTTFAFAQQTLKLDDKDLLKGKAKTSFQKRVQEYWKIFKQPKIENSEDQQEQSEEEEVQEAKDKNSLPDKTESGAKEDTVSRLSVASKRSQVDYDSDPYDQEEDQDDWDWLKASQPNNVYFVLYSKRVHQKGEQLYNFYGRRSNRFLLEGYNFVMADNKYDSFPLRLNIEVLSTKKPVVKDLVLNKLSSPTAKTLCTRELRIKRQRICIQLIDHCRVIVLCQQSAGIKPPTTFSPPLTIPSDRDSQQKTLGLAKQILVFSLKNMFTTSIQEDDELLENKALTENMRSALLLRREYKFHLQEQIKLIDKCIEYLGRWKKGKVTLDEKQMGEVAKIRLYIYELERSRL